MTPETPDFATTALALAQAVCAVYPDLTFTKDEGGTVTILAGGLQLVVAPIPGPPASPAPEPLTEENESLSGFAMPRRGAYPGEDNHVRYAGHPEARSAFRREAAINQDVQALLHMDFDAVPAGGLQPIEYKALCKARLRAQQLMLAQPQNTHAKAAYAILHQRWVAENAAQRAEQAPTQTLSGFQAPVGIKGYEGD